MIASLGFDAERDRRIHERASRLLQDDVALRVLARVLPHKARLEAIALAIKEIDMKRLNNRGTEQ